MISHPAVAVISAAILAYEVLLVRLFAIVQWHHFAYMAISVALLGFGVSGTLLAVFRRRVLHRAAAVFRLSALVFAAGAPLGFLLSQHLPFNALKVVWAPGQLLYIGLIYLLLAVPFTAGAVCIGLGFLKHTAAPGRVYLWNLLGSGAGALGGVAALFWLPPMTCLAWVAATGLAAAVIGDCQCRAYRGLVTVVGAGAMVAAAWLAAPAAWTTLQVSDFKGLTRALATHDARLAAQYSSPLALLSVVDSPTVPFRYAPGLSLRAPALPPPQLGVFADGEFSAAIDLWDGRPEGLDYLDHVTDALGYHLTRRPDVLVLDAAGGRAVLQAMRYDAPRIDAVELNPDMIRLVRHDFADLTGRVYARPGVHVHTADARRFLTAGSRTWDLIQMPLLDGGAGAGARGLNESYLHTVEGFGSAYDRLRADGWLSITTRVDLPPRTALKLVATLGSLLSRREITDAAGQLLMIRGMTTVTVMLKRGRISLADMDAARTFARARAFDLVHYPGMTAAEANLVNRLAEPVFFDAVTALLGPGHEFFVRDYKFDIAPATDDRPYFHDFFKWTTLPELAALGPAGNAALLELGEPIVAATLVQALLLSLFLVLLPLRTRLYAGKPRPMTWRFGVYFSALGIGFLFIEIAWIQKFVLFLGNPLYAVSVVLTGFLVFAGLGAGVSAWLGRRLTGSWSAVDAAVIAVTGIALAYLLTLPVLFDALSGLAGPMRVALALALIAPLAFFMGMPFPLGLARLARADPDLIPWAWGLNGCASVVSAAAATLMTMHLGFSAVVVIAAGLYGLAAFALHPVRTV